MWLILNCPRLSQDLKETKFDKNDPVYGIVILKQKIKKFKDSEKLT